MPTMREPTRTASERIRPYVIGMDGQAAASQLKTAVVAAEVGVSMRRTIWYDSRDAYTVTGRGASLAKVMRSGCM